MKVLFSFAFTLELEDEDDIPKTLSGIDEGVRSGIENAALPAGVTFADLDDILDFYPATASIRLDISDAVNR